MRIDRNRMRAVVEIGRKEGECRTGYAKVGGESGEKNMMIYGIEGRREIKKNKSRDLLLVDGEEIIVDAEKSSLSGMELAIGRLKRGKRRKRVKMVDKASVDDALEDFGNKIKIGNRAVAGEIIDRKGVFFVEGSDNSMLEGKRKGGFRNGKINESGEWKDKNIET